MRGPRKFRQMDLNLATFFVVVFLIDEGRQDPTPL